MFKYILYLGILVCSEAALKCTELGQFQCNDGSCITDSLVWNGMRDCSRGEDEVGADYESVYACEWKTININCRRGEVISILNANYGRLSRQICSDDSMYTTNCKAWKSLSILKERCNLKTSCTVSAANEIFGDPCRRTLKYLEVHYQCIKLAECTEHEFQCYNGHCIDKSKKCDGQWDCSSGEDEQECDYLTEYACETTLLTLECQVGTIIKIIGANYGRQLPYICKPQTNVNCLSINSKQKLQHRCDGNRRCSIEARNAQFGDPCVGTLKYLAVNYKCIDPNNIINEPVIEV